LGFIYFELSFDPTKHAVSEILWFLVLGFGIGFGIGFLS